MNDHANSRRCPGSQGSRGSRLGVRVAPTLSSRPTAASDACVHSVRAVTAVTIVAGRDFGSWWRSNRRRASATVAAGAPSGHRHQHDDGNPVRADVSIDRPCRTISSARTRGRFIVPRRPRGRIRSRDLCRLRAGRYRSDDSWRRGSHPLLQLRMIPQLRPCAPWPSRPERTLLRGTGHCTPKRSSASSGAEVAPGARASARADDAASRLRYLRASSRATTSPPGFNAVARRRGQTPEPSCCSTASPIYNPFHLGGLFGTFIDNAGEVARRRSLADRRDSRRNR